MSLCAVSVCTNLLLPLLYLLFACCMCSWSRAQAHRKTLFPALLCLSRPHVCPQLSQLIAIRQHCRGAVGARANGFATEQHTSRSLLGWMAGSLPDYSLPELVHYFVVPSPVAQMYGLVHQVHAFSTRFSSSCKSKTQQKSFLRFLKLKILSCHFFETKKYLWKHFLKVSTQMNSTWHRRLCACRRSASHSDRISKSDCLSIVNDMMAERAPGHFQFVNLHCTWAWPVLGRAEHIASSQWKECSGRRTVVSGQWTIGRRPRWRPLRPELSSSAATWRCWSPSDTKPPSPLCSVCVCVCAEYKYFNESSLLPVDFHNCDPGSGGQLLAALLCPALPA